ncbi:hypothetical protein QF042_002958 [Pedobacter sp. W3I1]|uniref:hypothetical protein n=1 Tax=Pedobacter sp. W3I1 TaxID=3042291 RepID=UPI0027865836|nr:hypothetical protein [Pedobacter sp. W3I1]MDQ0639393.1 hypothetical protein [Pedobacter sp. W3I1]
MNKGVIIGIALLTIVFISRQFYTLSDTYIKKHTWLHGEGHGSDLFLFDKDDDIRSDTIYINGQAEGFILKRGYRPLIPNYLVIKSLSTNEIGTFHEK